MKIKLCPPSMESPSNTKLWDECKYGLIGHPQATSSFYKAIPAECQTVETLCKDEQEQAVFSAIKGIDTSQKTDDKLIVHNLNKNGFMIVRLCDD